MKKRPDLPPRPRGRPARRLTSAAALGRFELPVCTACGHVQYPVGEVCGRCLSELTWESVSRTGTVLAATAVHHATEAYFQKLRPVRMGTVKLDAGPVVLARLSPDLGGAGQRVAMSIQLDRSGEAVLCASVEGTMEVENVLADPNRDIAGRTVLVTGAGGGIGSALVAAFIEAGAAEVIAATRTGEAREFASGRGKVTQIVLDVADAASVRKAADEVGARADILVNNAGVTAISGFLEGPDTQGARREMEVNYFGTLEMVRAFAPFMKARRRGVVVNVLTVLAHVCLPSMGSYCASKAAALSLTQGIRAELIPWGIRVCAIFPSTVDTPASIDSAPPKLAPRRVAAEVVRMIRDGEEDCYPGDIARDLAAAIRKDAKTVEREMSLALPEPSD